MDLNSIKDSIVKNVYHVPSDKNVPLHDHKNHDEVFYCIKGTGFGILEDQEIELNVGDVFIAPAKQKHSL